MIAGSLWAVFTVVAALSQTIRNATQRELIKTLGVTGATHVRFLFGLPFAVLFLVGVATTLERGLAVPPHAYWPWVVLGAAAQIAATALMLAAMGGRSFVVTIAYIKTEPVQVALFGVVLLGDHLTAASAAAILIATAGVFVMSLKPGADADRFKPTLLGLAAAAMFGLSAIGFRGAILSLGDTSFVYAATFTLVIGLGLQTATLTLWLVCRERPVLIAILKAWRPSLLAGFVGALASQFWFLAFALTSAANVRTLALVEVLFAQGVSHFAFGQPTTRREGLGIALIIAGVVLLIWAY
jgi:drug/metabolite transporter (DMT)-like permease